MTFRRICAAVALALVAPLLISPAAATAAPPTIWNAAPCATGAITRHAVFPDHQGRADLVLAGWMRACGEPVPEANFGIMEYRPSIARLVYSGQGPELHPYGRFAAVVALDTAFAFDAEFGPVGVVCVARDYEEPIACLGVERSGSGRVRSVAPVSTRDPRVTSVPVFRLPEMGPWPHCGNCV